MKIKKTDNSFEKQRIKQRKSFAFKIRTDNIPFTTIVFENYADSKPERKLVRISFENNNKIKVWGRYSGSILHWKTELQHKPLLPIFPLDKLPLEVDIPSDFIASYIKFFIENSNL